MMHVTPALICLHCGSCHNPVKAADPVAAGSARGRARSVALLAALLALIPFTPTLGAETNTVSDIGLKLLAEGFNAPIALVSIPDGSGRLLVADQAGVIYL